MNSTPRLEILVERINRNLDQADDNRLKAGRDLIEARLRVEAGDVRNLPWPAWCAQNIKRSLRDIRRLMAMAADDDPVRAREAKKARNRAAKQPGSRATSPFQAHDEGVGAFLRGVPQSDCPYIDRKRHAAWRKGWSETEGRTGASPPVAPAVDGVRNPLAELRQAMEHYWPLLSRADQELLIDWLIEHRADPPISAVA